jgi:hypothetical protein
MAYCARDDTTCRPSRSRATRSRSAEGTGSGIALAKLRRMKFGHSSEKLDRQIEQLELRLEALQVNSAEIVAAQPEPIAKQESARPARRPLPEHLPREIRTHLPKQEACPDCGGELRKLGGRHLGSVGAYSGALPGDSACSREARVQVLRTHRASGSTHKTIFSTPSARSQLSRSRNGRVPTGAMALGPDA